MQRILTLNQGKQAVFYTDGSVDQITGRSGAGIVLNTSTGHCQHVTIRIRDQASTLQTELTAISGALVLAFKGHYQQSIIHTDSLSSLQALQAHWPQDNRNLCTSTRKLLNDIVQTGGSVSFNWIPSHVGISQNEKADNLAKQATVSPDINVRSLKNSRSQHKRSILQQTLRLHRGIVDRAQLHSDSLQWLFLTTGYRPLTITKKWPRSFETGIYRLRLGYRCKWEIAQRHLRPCDYCLQPTSEPLLHYILECPLTSPVFGNPVSTQHYDSITVATNRLKCASRNPSNLIDLIRIFPPPR